MAVYNPNNKPGTCLWCGRKLPGLGTKRRSHAGPRGEFFHSDNCAVMYAIVLARGGRRLAPVTHIPAAAES